MSIFNSITVEQIKEMRETSGLGMMECKRILKDKIVRRAICDMKMEFDDRRYKNIMSEVLLYLLERK